jgi:RAB protein geranylgeranyltransferase component A
MQEFDYIIVGAGRAGCALAGRLSEGHRVLKRNHYGRIKRLKNVMTVVSSGVRGFSFQT